MVQVPSVTHRRLSLGSTRRTEKTHRGTIIPGHNPSTRAAMTSVLWKVTLGRLIRDRPTAHHHCRAHHLLDPPLPVLIGIRVLRIRQPAAPPRTRPHVLPPSCPLIHCLAFHHFTKLPRCVPRNRKPRRVSRLAISSQRKQARKANPCPTISQHRFVRANRHRRSQLQKYVPQKC